MFLELKETMLTPVQGQIPENAFSVPLTYSDNFTARYVNQKFSTLDVTSPNLYNNIQSLKGELKDKLEHLYYTSNYQTFLRQINSKFADVKDDYETYKLYSKLLPILQKEANSSYIPNAFKSGMDWQLISKLEKLRFISSSNKHNLIANIRNGLAKIVKQVEDAKRPEITEDEYCIMFNVNPLHAAEKAITQVDENEFLTFLQLNQKRIDPQAFFYFVNSSNDHLRKYFFQFDFTEKPFDDALRDVSGKYIFPSSFKDGHFTLDDPFITVFTTRYVNSHFRGYKSALEIEYFKRILVNILELNKLALTNPKKALEFKDQFVNNCMNILKDQNLTVPRYYQGEIKQFFTSITDNPINFQYQKYQPAEVTEKSLKS